MKTTATHSDPDRSNLLILFCVCLFSYIVGIGNGFIVDDFLFVTGKYALVFRSPLDYLTVTESQHYQPLYYFVNQSIFKLFGPNPIPYRMLNIGLLFGACAAVYLFVVTLTNRKQLGLSTAILFAVHPLTANSVIQITHNVVLICLIAVLGSLILWLKYTETHRRAHLAGSLGFFAAGLLCVEAMALTPVYLVAVLMLFKRRSLWDALRGLWPFAVVLAVFLALWVNVAVKNLFALHFSRYIDVTPLMFISSYGKLLFWYLRNLILPYDVVLSFNIAHPQVSLWGVFPFAVAGMAVWLWRMFAQQPERRLALVWLGSGFVYVIPALLTHPYMGIVLSPHWLLVPSLGFYFLVASLLMDLQRRMRPMVWKSTAAGLVLYFVLFTFGYQRMAKTEERFCAFWLEQCPYNVTALVKYGVNLDKGGRYPEAIEVFGRVLETGWVQRGLIYANMANSYLGMGRLDEAEEAARKAVDGPGREAYVANAFNSLGIIGVYRGNRAEAEINFWRAYELNPLDTAVIYNLSDLYILDKRNDVAINFLENVPKNLLPPADRHMILARLAGLYFRKNDINRGFDYIDGIVKEDPSFETFYNIAGTLKSLGFEDLARLIVEAGIKTYPEKARQLRSMAR